MKAIIRLPEKKLYIILILCALLIFSNSLETMVRIKDLDIYEDWLEHYKTLDEYDESKDSYEVYKGVYLNLFILKVLVPVGLGLYSFLMYKYMGINLLSIVVWVLLLIGGLVSNIFELQLGSIFYYINIVVYLALIVVVISLNSTICSHKHP